MQVNRYVNVSKIYLQQLKQLVRGLIPVKTQGLLFQGRNSFLENKKNRCRSRMEELSSSENCNFDYGEWTSTVTKLAWKHFCIWVVVQLK